ncbi:MAG: COR domain-containing protein, partial [Bacteroidota bacterium]
ASWPDIRRELGEMREKRRISFGTYASICEKYGLDEESSQLLLSRYLSRLGELLHYEHGGLLFDNLLLDIDWITTTVYGITQNQDIIDRNGSFSRQEVVNVWKSQGITNRTDHELMLQLLQADAFELCWKEEGKDRYMTPSLFTVKAPSAEEVRTDIGMRYSTSYLPKGLLGQLIVRLHRYAEVDHYWRYGIFLSHNSCRARVHQPPGEHYIDIAVEGNAPDHYALLSIIQQELETVHQRTFSRIQFDLKIPCPCERCRSKDWEQDYFPRELLEKLQHSGDPIVICKNQKQTNINLLLKGFQNQNQPSIMGFLDQIRQLVGRNRTQEALELIDKRFPSNDISVLLRDYSELQSNRISGILSSDEERRISNQINIRLLNLAGSLEKTTSTTQQRQTIEEQLPEIRQQLDRIEATGQDTNDKVTLLGHMVKHVLMDIDEVKGDLFADRKEQRAFMNKLEEKVEALPAAEQPGEDWYDKPAKQKIKISLPLLPFVKYEREMDLSEATIPKTWAAFKNWFGVSST